MKQFQFSGYFQQESTALPLSLEKLIFSYRANFDEHCTVSSRVQEIADRQGFKPFYPAKGKRVDFTAGLNESLRGSSRS